MRRPTDSSSDRSFVVPSASIEADFHALFVPPSALFDDNMRRHSVLQVLYRDPARLRCQSPFYRAAGTTRQPRFSVEKIRRRRDPFRHGDVDWQLSNECCPRIGGFFIS